MVYVVFTDQNGCTVIGLLNVLRRNTANNGSRLILDGCEYVRRIGADEHEKIASGLSKSMLDYIGEPIPIEGVWNAE